MVSDSTNAKKNSRKVPPIGEALREPVRFCAGANAG